MAMSDFGKAVLLLLLVVGLVGAAPNGQTNSSTETSVQKIATDKGGKNLDNDGKKLPPVEREGSSDFNGLIEVNEDEIPEGALVYVLDEPLDQPVDDEELLNTANNIAFRPLFRYRGKQEFHRRSSQRFRRRYFIPRRNVYYPYYQSYRYHY